ncbi:hypothetical protein E2562_034040 [Oryza meyeriana var. granulata]|uniref:Uncharacterized protein n=1 Tax=Oryza meyeriana var. granulata TaxID=110450 RepID=A0A6G1E6X2_9ORYZ|nr:hypothetical protein E2562_034040 [Oryza meyeriana var. granulata]
MVGGTHPNPPGVVAKMAAEVMFPGANGIYMFRSSRVTAKAEWDPQTMGPICQLPTAPVCPQLELEPWEHGLDMPLCVPERA